MLRFVLSYGWVPKSILNAFSKEFCCFMCGKNDGYQDMPLVLCN